MILIRLYVRLYAYIMLSIYVDDGILIGNNESEINNVLENLGKQFEIF